MKKTAPARKISIALMSLTVLAVLLLGMVGSVAWAHNGPGGTVPQPSPEAPAQALILPPEQPTEEVGDCGIGLDTDTATNVVPDSVLRVLEIQPGTAQLGSPVGVASITADTILPKNLPGAPTDKNWELLTCGLQTSGIATQAFGGGPVVLFRRGPVVCFPYPPGYDPYKIFYWDPGLGRWVGLVTILDPIDTEACTSFRIPAVFALFGVPIPPPGP